MPRKKLKFIRSKVVRKDQTLVFSEFLKVILDFQLAEHERYLAPFNRIFKQIDRDQNGVIDEVSL